MAQQSGHAARQSKEKNNELKAKEKKLIDAIIKDEDTSNKKLGILRRHPYYKASVARAKKEKEVREEREKKGLPPENIFQKSKRRGAEKEVPKIEVGPAPKVTALKPADSTPTATSTPAPVSKKDPTEGERFAFYPGQTSKDLGLMYEVDRNKMSDEVRGRLEEAELYEGDSKGGRVGKGKKKKVSKAPRGVRAALRGFKPKMGAGKGNKRTRGTGGGWV
tara:strand:- start:288 stop:947 length:660 start_codon:yes stop_codon:yes gene_type:complete